MICVSVLCSNRVSQMTKTYNDIEAVTQLLAEVSRPIYHTLLIIIGFYCAFSFKKNRCTTVILLIS